MKKRNISFLLVILTTLFLTACQNNDNESNKNNNNEKIENTEQKNTEDVGAKSNEKNEQEEQSQFINEAFHTLLDYDNSTYSERSQEITKYFTGEALQALTGNEHLDIDVSFESKSDNYNLYQGVGKNNNNFILILESSFQLEDNQATELESIYEFELLEQNDKYKINDLESTPKQQQTKIP